MVVRREEKLGDRLRQEVETLAREFAGTFSFETVQRCVDEQVDVLKHAPVHEYVPVLVHKATRDRLRQLALIENARASERPVVLFICGKNAGRSQMAAAFLNELGGGRVVGASAGTGPADAIHVVVQDVMAELGIDLSRETPKRLTDELAEAADVLVTMGCEGACPLYPGKRYLDWEFDDPAGESLEVVRLIRDEIRGRVETLVAALVDV